MRGKIRPDEAESEGCGGPTGQTGKTGDDNEGMAGFSPQPEGTGAIFPISASLVAKIRPVSVTPHSLTWAKWPPVAATPEVGTGPSGSKPFLAVGNSRLRSIRNGKGGIHEQRLDDGKAGNDGCFCTENARAQCGGLPAGLGKRCCLLAGPSTLRTNGQRDGLRCCCLGSLLQRWTETVRERECCLMLGEQDAETAGMLHAG